jgi:hypothetical protein
MRLTIFLNITPKNKVIGSLNEDMVADIVFDTLAGEMDEVASTIASDLDDVVDVTWTMERANA